jgi:glutathione S-transferase
MITVHHLEQSRSHRVLWALEELGVPYTIESYKRDPVTMLAPPELRRVHPLGKSPVVTDEGRTLAESGAILEYLVDRYGAGKLFPKNEEERIRYRFFLHYAEGSVMAPLLLKLVFETLKKKAPWPVRPIAKAMSNKVLGDFVHPQMKTHFDFVEAALEKSTWFAGDELTAADIQMSFPLQAFAARGDMSNKPRIRAFIDRVEARPAWKRVVERGGPLTIL